ITNQGGTWLTVSPQNATTPSALTVSVNGAGLLANTYTGSILISSPGSQNTLTVNVTLTVTNAPTIVVNPTGLTPVNFQIGTSNPPAQTVSVSTSSGVPSSFTASANMTTGTGWLSVS